MNTWFECKVRSLITDQGGYERKVTETFLLNAINYTEAEERIHKKMLEMKRQFDVKGIKQSNITDIIANKDGEWWWKAKLSLVTIDEASGKEKKVNNYAIVSADDINDALIELEKGLEYLMIPYTTTSITLSPIIEVFPHNEE